MKKLLFVLVAASMFGTALLSGCRAEVDPGGVSTQTPLPR